MRLTLNRRTNEKVYFIKLHTILTILFSVAGLVATVVNIVLTRGMVTYEESVIYNFICKLSLCEVK